MIEAGPAWRGLPIRIPAAVSTLYQQGRYHWKHLSEPEQSAVGQRMLCKMGRILGGSSAINGMIWVRGNHADFDNWAKSGCSGWSWDEVEPLFRRIEDFDDPDDPHMGHGGPISVVRGDTTRAPLNRAFMESAVQAGHVINHNYNGRDQHGFCSIHRNTRRGARSDVYHGYLAPALTRSNLHVLTETVVERIVFADGNAVAVQCHHGGQKSGVMARHEILLCAGALGSPQLLQLSGIGPVAKIESLGVRLLHALSGVGGNLHTHPVVKLSYECLQPVSIYPWTKPPRIWIAGAQWLLRRTGPAASNHMEVGAFLSSHSNLVQPDLEVTLVPITFDGIFGKSDRHGFDIYIELIGCKSRGSLVATSTDPEVSPTFCFNFFEDPRDLAALRRGVAIVRELVAQPAFASYCGAETQPGPEVTSDAELNGWLREKIAVTHHIVGTCRMGPVDDPLAVVGPDLRLHGIRGLRVVDASIMPDVVSGNTHAAVIMIAECAADMIIGGAAD